MDQAVAHKIKWTDPEWQGGGLNLVTQYQPRKAGLVKPMKLQKIEFISIQLPYDLFISA